MYHSHKNVLFSINILAQQAAQDYGSRQSKEAVNRILEITSLSLSKTSEMLDTLREVRYQFKRNNLYDAIDEALKKVCIPPHIGLLWRYEKEARNGAVCRFDFYHISKVFVNILNNAVEAIELVGRERGSIEIYITSQFQWFIILIKDNGIGFKETRLTKYFSPYHSDKNTTHNWGLGLSYVYKVIKAHLGYVWIESKYGEFTSVHIMLPRA